MNIKEHIEAGHYPLDDRGRALVPTRGGRVATIYATDHGAEGWPIIGRCDFGGLTWNEDGCLQSSAAHGCDLLPPPPRKVEVTKFILHRFAKGAGYHMYDTREDAERAMRGILNGRVVELTGSYEEPWE